MVCFTLPGSESKERLVSLLVSLISRCLFSTKGLSPPSWFSWLDEYHNNKRNIFWKEDSPTIPLREFTVYSSSVWSREKCSNHAINFFWNFGNCSNSRQFFFFLNRQTAVWLIKHICFSEARLCCVELSIGSKRKKWSVVQSSNSRQFFFF